MVDEYFEIPCNNVKEILAQTLRIIFISHKILLFKKVYEVGSKNVQPNIEKLNLFKGNNFYF